MPLFRLVQGDWSPCKKLAKVSAAVLACRALHEADEVNARGRPILRRSQPPSSSGNSSRLSPNAASAPLRQKLDYPIEVPDALTNCLACPDDAGGLNYLYVIRARLLDTALGRLQRVHGPHAGDRPAPSASQNGDAASPGVKSSGVVFGPESEEREFAILTSKPLPRVGPLLLRPDILTRHIHDFACFHLASQFPKGPNLYSPQMLQLVDSRILDLHTIRGGEHRPGGGLVSGDSN